MSQDLLDMDLSATCDATGAGSTTIIPRAAHYAVLKIIGQVTGSASWTVLLNGQPVTFGRGPRVDLGPIVTQPGDKITLSVQGAIPLSPIRGRLIGAAAIQLDQVLAMYSPAPNTIALDVAAPQLDLGQVAGTAGPGGSRTFLVPPNTYALAILPQGGVTGFTSLVVTGIQSGDTYAFLTAAGGLPTDVIYVPLGTQAFDSQVKVAGSVTGAGTATMEVVALLAPIAIAASITGVGTTPITSGGQDLSPSGGNSIPVVPAANYTPTPWQAARSVKRISFAALTAGAGNAIQLVAPVVNQSVYLFGAGLQLDAAAAAGGIHLDGLPAGPNEFRADFGSATAAPQRIDGSGAPGISGNGLSIWSDVNLTGGHGFVAWSQAP